MLIHFSITFDILVSMFTGLYFFLFRSSSFLCAGPISALLQSDGKFEVLMELYNNGCNWVCYCRGCYPKEFGRNFIISCGFMGIKFMERLLAVYVIHSWGDSSMSILWGKMLTKRTLCSSSHTFHLCSLHWKMLFIEWWKCKTWNATVLMVSINIVWSFASTRELHIILIELSLGFVR